MAEKKKSNLKTLILAIVAGVFAVSTVVLSIVAINLSGEINRLKEEVAKAQEDSELNADVAETYFDLTNSYCRLYLNDDLDFCTDYNLDLAKRIKLEDTMDIH